MTVAGQPPKVITEHAAVQWDLELDDLFVTIGHRFVWNSAATGVTTCAVLRALASPLPIAWGTADSAYGQESRCRRLLEPSGAGCVLAVPKSQSTVGCSRRKASATGQPGLGLAR